MTVPEAPICPACKQSMALMVASATPSEWPVRYWHCKTEGCEARFDHNCDEHAVPYESDGPIGHGFECGVCGHLLQVG